MVGGFPTIQHPCFSFVSLYFQSTVPCLHHVETSHLCSHIPRCIPNQSKLPKTALLLGCCFAEQFMFALCCCWMGKQDPCSRPSNPAVTSAGENCYPILLQELVRSQVGQRGGWQTNASSSLSATSCLHSMACCECLAWSIWMEEPSEAAVQETDRS